MLGSLQESSWNALQNVEESFLLCRAIENVFFGGPRGGVMVEFTVFKLCQ